MKTKIFQAIIETPRGSRCKYKYDADMNVFNLDKVLPAGFYFPFDFGLIPHTLAEDGDPIDVMVLMDEPSFPGCRVACRIIGAIEAEQTEGGRKIRNDRIIAIPELGSSYNQIHHLEKLDKKLLHEVNHFFIAYHSYNGVKFETLRLVGPAQAIKLIENATDGNA